MKSRFAATALLLAIASSAFGQSFDPNALRQTGPAISVRFGEAARFVPEAPSHEPAASGRFKLVLSPAALRALQTGSGPCADAQAQARADADAVAEHAAHDWFGMSAKSRRNWEPFAELIGGLLVDYAFPNSAYAPVSPARTVWTTAGKDVPARPGSVLGCLPSKPPPVHRAPATR